MAYITVSVEYGIHCLLWLVDNPQRSLSSRELAELQGVSPSFLAKILPRLEKAGIVKANEGIRGGYRLALPAEKISFLAIIDAIEGYKPLFECQEVRQRCAVFDGAPPDWAISDTCSVHKVILQAEKAMRDALATQTLAAVASRVNRITPDSFIHDVSSWMDKKIETRTIRTSKTARNKT
ncbi:RrF2 family transcriptional regulator [Proteus myxofaciens]|uniref:Putative NADH dehydrogenase transcriptional regulator n=1 Tax=Proteus myxofaciens ATCC 19692 TaxID=1354337 RepID=A0A198FHQ9_9GAMM|nr:Rrf2 family transcriptional regulator [Proteus myxofaciens]OAT24310.1 putative NADH dehydrogenase transcriptional regulator [Proteus myxofaciens ATCC 19692]